MLVALFQKQDVVFCGFEKTDFDSDFDFEKMKCKQADGTNPNFEVGTTSHFKKKILVQDQDGGEIETGGILQYSEDFNFTANEDIGAKDIFEIACKKITDGKHGGLV